VLDDVVAKWEQRHTWTSKEASPAKLHLYRSFGKIKVRRELYFAGEVAGDSGRNLMINMKQFCDIFFCKKPNERLPLIEYLREIVSPKRGLEETAGLYNGYSNLEGLGFYLNTQRAWTPQMIEKWKWISSEFIEKLYNTIGRPALKSKYYEGFQHKESWRVPLTLPKLHAMSAHAHEIIEDFNCFGSMAEQSMEHKHKISWKNRNTFSPNQSIGQQIVEDMRQSWVQSSETLNEVL